MATQEPLARSPHPRHRRDERRVHEAVESRRLGEFSGEGTLQSAQLGRNGQYPPVGLTLAEGRGK